MAGLKLTKWALACLFCMSIHQNKSQDFQWKRTNPESVGMSSRILAELQEDLEQRGTKKLLIIKNHHILWEWFAEGWHDTIRTHYTASMAKAIAGGMSLLVALDKGLLYPDMPACALIPQWKSHPQKSMITIRQLATHTSGLDDAEESDEVQNRLKEQGIDAHKGLTGWKGQFWRQEPDPFSVSRDSTRVLFPPGTRFNYSNPGIGMLSYAVTASLGSTNYTDIRSLLWDEIYQPIGITPSELSIGYGRTFQVEGLELVPSWGGGSASANAVARLGRLMLLSGQWQEEKLVGKKSIRQVLEYAGTAIPGNDPDFVSERYSLRNENNSYPATTMGWYTNYDKVWNHIPRDAFAAGGAGHQLLLVVPSLDLIVVRFGDDLSLGSGEGFWLAAEKYVFNPVMDAIVKAPYPGNVSIKGVDFDAETTRLAEGSDNWPITWADDDHLYTAYGDGWGFQPGTDIKLSLGLARMEGKPPDIHGVNIRSVSGERVGQGRFGVKASGMLSIDGILYMLVRNAGNSQLAWSEDHGKSWTWADWRFDESLGCPTFLNFGQNYQGARDDFVYLYSPDQSSAYITADLMILARVPKDSLGNRQAYQFFSGTNRDNSPRWTSDIHRRKPVFTNPGKCYRSGISYNAGLEKYQWVQIIPLANDEEGPRFRGGLGIFLADEPWGPWETVFYTREWDIGPGETASIPTKWISEDGLTFHLVFSGDDFFSVRKGTFKRSKN